MTSEKATRRAGLPGLVQRVWDIRFVRYLLVGGTMALSYAILVSALLALTGMPAGLAGLLGSVIITPITYFGQRLVTFGGAGRVQREFSAFMLVGVVVFVLGGVSVHVLVEILGVPPFFAALVTTLLIPLVSYLLQSRWVFTQRSASS